MADLLTVADLEKAKKHNTFHVEVITGKVGGLSTGADIDYSTNAVTGQVQKTLPKVISEAEDRINELGVPVNYPIPDWTPITEINVFQAYRSPDGDLIFPKVALPFTTAATFVDDFPNWGLMQGLGDLDGITTEALEQPTQITMDGILEYDAPGVLAYPKTMYYVYLDGVRQFNFSVPSAGKIEFDEQPPSGVDLDVTLFAPVTEDNIGAVNSPYYAINSSIATTINKKLQESATLQDYGATGVIDDDATSAFILACTHNEHVIIRNGQFHVSLLTTIPAEAKVCKIEVVNATLWLEDGFCDIILDNKDLVIDLSANGVIHGGLRKVKVAADTAVGEFVIPCVDTTDIKVGDVIASSFQFFGAVGGSKWTNSIRVEGDEFNTVLSKTANSITVQFPVGAAVDNTTDALWANMWLGNARFDRPGLRFTGTGNVNIIGGRIIESRAGYYISTVCDNPAGLKVTTHNTVFNGQFLDAFSLAGYTSFTMNGGEVVGSYDLAKQAFFYKIVGDNRIELNNVYIQKGNNDLDFYTSGENTQKIGKLILNNCRLDGSWTLDVPPEQLNAVTGETLVEAYPQVQDGLHVWAFTELFENESLGYAELGGFQAYDCTFSNYKRSVAGTTFVRRDRNYQVDNIDLIDCEFIETSPVYITVTLGRTAVVKSRRVHNPKITRSSLAGNVHPIIYDDAGNDWHISGTCEYDPNGGDTTNSQLRYNVSVDHLYVKGAGALRLSGVGETIRVGKLTVDTSTVYPEAMIADDFGFSVSTSNGGYIAGTTPYSTNVSPFGVSTTYVKIPDSSTDWFDICEVADSTNEGYFTITLSGFREYAGTYGISGVIGARVGTEEVLVKSTSNKYTSVLTGSSAYWISDVVSYGFTAADDRFKLRIHNGKLQISNTVPLPDGLSMIVSVLGGMRGVTLVAPPTNQPTNPPTITADLPSKTVGFVGYGEVLYPQIANATSYQWYKNGVAIDGAYDNAYNVNVVIASDGDQYHCVASNPYGAVVTAVTTIAVRAGVYTDWEGNAVPVIITANSLAKALFKADGTVEFYADGALSRTERWTTVGSPSVTLSEYQIRVGILPTMPAAFSTVASEYKLNTTTTMLTDGDIEIDISAVPVGAITTDPDTGTPIYVAYLYTKIEDKLHLEQQFNGYNQGSFGLKKAGNP